MNQLLNSAATLLLLAGATATALGEGKANGPLDFKLKNIKGETVDLSKFKGKVILLVNVASECGLTGQYEALQSLYKKYGESGLVVIGVPANEFGKQEPGTNEQIAKFCESNYKVTFPMMAKIVIKGDGIDPLYKFLTSKETNPKFGGDVTWNFEKFLIGRDGKVIGRFEPNTTPDDESVIKAIKTALDAK